MKKNILLILSFLIFFKLSALDHIGPPGIVGELLTIDPISGFNYVTTLRNSVFRMDIQSNEWQQLQIELSLGEDIGGIDAFNDNIIIATTEHIYRSIDGGVGWEISDNGITEIGIGRNVHIYEPSPNIIFVQAGANMWYRSVDNGVSWQALPNMGTTNFSYNQESGLVVLMNSFYIWKSYDLGITWEETTINITNTDFYVTSLSVIDDFTYICGGVDYGYSERVFITYNAGISWENITYGFDFNFVTDIIKCGDDIVISVLRGESESPHGGVYKLDLQNQTWFQLGDEFAKENTGYNIESYNNLIYHLSLRSGLFTYNINTEETFNYIPNNVFENTAYFCNGNSISNQNIDINASFLFQGENNLNEWTRVDSVYNIFEMARSQFDEDLCIALSIRRGIYSSEDGGENWTISNNGIEENNKSLINNVHFLNEDVILVSGYETMLHSSNTKSFIYRSSNGGQNWVKTLEHDTMQGDNHVSLDQMIEIDGVYYALMSDSGLQKTEDLGLTWESVFYLENRSFRNMVYCNQTGEIYIFSKNYSISPSISEIYKSNNFEEWSECVSGFSQEYRISDFAVNPTNPSSIICSISPRTESNIFCPHVMISNDNCLTWQEYSFNDFDQNLRILEFRIIPETNELIFSVSNSSLYISDWNFSNSNVNEIELLNHKLLSFPNPFNPATTFSFYLQNLGIVELSIFNVKGQKIKNLIDREYLSGNHKCIWDGTDEYGAQVASGVYLVKLQYNKKVFATKVMLLR